MRPWLVGFLAGASFAILVGLSFAWIFRVEILNYVSNLYGQRVVGETKILQRNSVLYQDGNEIGTLKRGTRLLQRLQTESLEEFYLPMGWESEGDMDKIFSPAGETERAFVILGTNSKGPGSK